VQISIGSHTQLHKSFKALEEFCENASKQICCSSQYVPQNKLKHPVEVLLNFARNLISFVVQVILRINITINEKKILKNHYWALCHRKRAWLDKT